MKIWSWISGIVGNNSKSRPLIFAAILLFVILAFSCSLARSAELHLETGITAIHGTGPFLSVYMKFNSSPALGGETGFQFWGKTSKYDGHEIASNWSPSALIDVQKGPIYMGFGVTYLQLTDRLDGSHLNIALKLGGQITDRLGITLRHLSNAGTVAPNVGRNSIALDWRLQ